MAGKVVTAIIVVAVVTRAVQLVKRAEQDAADWRKIALGYKWKVGERQGVIDNLRKAG